jgi:erythronate-4-phosphate dehydrogenase
VRIVADENIPGLKSMLGSGVDLLQVPGRDLTAAALEGADALFVRSVTRVDRTLLEDTLVRFVGSATSGYDHVDTHYLAQAGINFAHAPGANANSVVEYVLAAIAAVDDFLERVLADAVVGIIGYGHVGTLLAVRLDALHIAYRVYDPWLEQGAIAHATDLQAVLNCDVVTLHPNLTDETPFPSRYLLGQQELAGLGGHQLLINASRGPVVDNALLLTRLQAAAPPAVVLDVWENEPQIDDTLLAMVQLGTAHIAGYSLDSKMRGTAMLVGALADFLPASDLAVDVAAGRADPAALVDIPDLNDVNLVRDLLLAHCPIREDDVLLRQAVTSENPAAAFDGLRRNYAPRYELAGKLMSGVVPAEQIAVLGALGCRARQKEGQ